MSSVPSAAAALQSRHLSCPLLLLQSRHLCRLLLLLTVFASADLQAQLIEAHNTARLEVTAAQSEAAQLQTKLQDSQRQLNQLQQQLKGSSLQLDATAESGLAPTIQAQTW